LDFDRVIQLIPHLEMIRVEDPHANLLYQGRLAGFVSQKFIVILRIRASWAPERVPVVPEDSPMNWLVEVLWALIHTYYWYMVHLRELEVAVDCYDRIEGYPVYRSKPVSVDQTASWPLFSD
jgi:hypothetical protein